MADETKTLGGLSPEQKRALLADLLKRRAQKSRDIHPLSHNQRAMWFLHRLDPSTSAYNTAFAARVSSNLDIPLLRECFEALVARHQALRTTFIEHHDEPFQEVHGFLDLDFAEIDAEGVTEEELRRRVAHHYALPFDLERGPLLRVRFFRRGAGDSDSVLLIVVHHIVIDGWSLRILIEEIQRLYAQRIDPDAAPALPPIQAEYTDYVRWQQEMLESAEGAELRQFWLERLSGELPQLALPLDPPARAEAEPAGASHPFEIGEDLARPLESLARARRTTLFTVILAAWQTLLSRYSGQEDILVGTPTFGRSRGEFANTVGDFINPVVLRGDLSADPTFAELIDRLRPVVQGALGAQDYPFSLLVEELAPRRDPNDNPIFQAMFNLHQPQRFSPGGEAAEIKRNGRTLLDLNETYPLDQQEGQLLIILEMVDRGGWLSAVLKYDARRLSPESVGRMQRHFTTLLSAVVADPDLPLSRIPLLDDAERRLVLEEWNRTERDYPRDASLLDLIRRQTEATPASTAVRFSDVELTYADLLAEVDRLAARVQSVGAGPGDLVGVCLPRSEKMLVALLAVLRAGAAYVPIDPSYPADRIAYVLEDSQARLLITDASLEAQIASVETPRLLIGAEDAAASDAEHPDFPSVRAENLAYVIYTSGSTGRPKGVRISHRALVNFLVSMRAEPGFTPEDLLLAVTTLSFDIAGLELYLPLIAGGTVVIASSEAVADASALAAHLQRDGITVMQATPATWRMLLDSGWRGDPRLKVLCGGEALPRELANRLAPLVGKLWNMYGPTETTIWSTVERIEAGEGPVLIGRPIANTQVYVLDRHLQPVPVGLTGELFIGGDGIAEGYHNRPDLTADRFIENPFRPGERIYRTGDLARWREGGRLECLGRVDFQVKVRGYRIELGEIENVLDAHPLVAQSVVVAPEFADGDRRLVAYYVPSGDASSEVRNLRAHLAQKLPPYMIPAAFIPLDSMPLTPNGKVDRKNLPPVPDLQAGPAAPGREPETETERILAGIWRKVLRRDCVAADVSFFELGGHSLLATQVVSRVKRTLGVELPLRDFFETPTVAGLAARVEAARRAAVEPLPGIQPADRSGPVRLSFTQERMWFMQQLAPENTAFNLSLAARLRGPLQPDLLERAFVDLIQRHESLRTTFETAEGIPVQVVHPDTPFKLARVNLSGFSPEQREDEARRQCSAEANRIFDLHTGPLLRAKLFKLDDDDHVLALTIHHIACDNWSFGIMRAELTELYNALVEKRPPDLPPLPIQYPDFAIWQRDWLSDERFDQRLQYWKKRLENLQPLELPTDRPRPPVQSLAGGEEALDLPPDLLERLEAFSRDEGASLFMTLLAAFQALLHRYSGQDDLAVGIPIANRNHLEVEGLIGAFLNTLVLRSTFNPGLTFRELLAQVREASLEAYAHQDLPFEFLVHELQPERDLSRHPLIQVLFNFHNAPGSDSPFKDVAIEVFDFNRGSTQVDLHLMVDARHEKKIRLEYDSVLFDADSIRRLLRHYLMLLEQIVSAAGRPVDDLRILTPEESEQVLHEWNRTERPYPREICLPHFVETQAESTPDAVAAQFADRSLTYEQLNRRANQVAHHLRRLGAGPDVLVAIAMDRSLDMLVGLLGILKSGAAYLPLDPDYPEQRLIYMLEDSRASILLTQSHLAPHLPRSGAKPVCIDTDMPADESAHTENLDPIHTPDNLAYVIYTSGSTGRPKGVQITHRSLVNFLFSMRRKPGMNERDVLLAVTTLSFDIAALELFLPLISGARLVIADRDQVADGYKLQQLLENAQPTLIQATPATFRLLLESGWSGDRRLRVLCGGEALPPDLAQRLLPIVGSLWNMYGPTETTIWSTIHEVTQVEEPVPIGAPIANTTVYLLDRDLRPVPVGVPGELYIGGDGLARGYLNRPDLTAERFIHNPFGPDPDSRIYKTGDLARWRPDGTLQYLGRIDSQVKLRGYRIELGEIESALASHPDVAEAAATVREDRPGDPRLIAAYVPRPDAAPDPENLRGHLRRTLPDYMIPAFFLPLEKLPLTPNGKVDRRALPSPDVSAELETDRYVAPRTQVEEILAEIWAGVLGLERIGVNDNFFELGGHSLLATRVIARMRERLQAEIPLRSLFQSPTVAGIATHILYDQSTGRYEFREKGGMKAEHIIAMQPNGSRPPFFIVAGAHADEDEFLRFLSNMIPYLGLDQPIYGFKARGLDGVADPHTSTEEMASDYIKEMRAFYPEGPYYIGGECIGGIVAFEMAQQLHDQGEEVALLLLMDTRKPNALVNAYAHADYWFRKTRSIAKTVFGPSTVPLAQRIRLLLERRRRRARLKRPLTSEERRQARIRRVQIQYDFILARYRPRVFPGKLTLIVNEVLYSRDPVIGWKGMARSGIEVLKVPGNHVTRLTEHAKYTAERLRAALDQAQSKTRNRPGRPH